MAEVTFNSPTHRLISQKIALKKNLSIIDFGCGEGELLRYLPLKNIKRYLGLEVNEGSIETAREKWGRNKRFQFEMLSQKKMSSKILKQSADAFFLIGVVQYLSKKELNDALQFAQKSLKKDGQLLVSTTTDHSVYKLVNIYRLFLPHHSVNRDKLLKLVEKAGFESVEVFERGLCFAPLFANVIVFFFDALDKVIFRTKGTLGFFGRTARKCAAPIISLEYNLPIDFGYTLFINAKKS